MNTRLALALFCLALLSGCAGTPRWDTSQFPQQPIYGEAAGTAPIASGATK